jgi:hypothetical protein
MPCSRHADRPHTLNPVAAGFNPAQALRSAALAWARTRRCTRSCWRRRWSTCRTTSRACCLGWCAPGARVGGGIAAVAPPAVPQAPANRAAFRRLALRLAAPRPPPPLPHRPPPVPPPPSRRQATPEEALQGVLQGADLFDCSYPTHATANGYALCFPLSPEAEAAAAGARAGLTDEAADEGADDSKLNLWSQAYRLDKRPLVPGCGCFACKSHTRAYVHHLLHQNEMLGSVLLEVHNTHWWLNFFEALRAAVARGRLQEYAEWFRARRAAARRLAEPA